MEFKMLVAITVERHLGLCSSTVFELWTYFNSLGYMWNGQRIDEVSFTECIVGREGKLNHSE